MSASRRLNLVSNNESSTACVPCGGKCCRNQPGITLPEEWGADDEEKIARLIVALKSGRWAVDYWEGDGDGPYWVRPAVMGAGRHPIDPSWGGRCNFHGDEGCELKFEARPHNCRALVPMKKLGGECKMPDGVGKYWYVQQWAPFQRIIVAALAVLGEEIFSEDRPADTDLGEKRSALAFLDEL